MRRKELIWILEDDDGIQKIFEEVLGPYYDLSFFATIKAFSNEYFKGEPSPDLLITDLQLEDGYFTDFLNSEEMQGEIFRFPFLIVSCIEDPNVLRYCFKKGAMDYLIKPFKKPELIVKVEKMLQMPKSVVPVSLGADSCGFINDPSLVARIEAIGNELTHKEFKILKTFLDSKNRRATREELIHNAWGDTNVSPSTLNVHLTYLRKKLTSINISIVSVEDGLWEFRV